MTTTFFDTSVLFSVLNDKEVYHSWSIAQLNACQSQGNIVISDIVYAEFSVGMATQAEVDAAVTNMSLDRFPRDHPQHDAALFRAGKAFKAYRRNRGPKKRLIADFLVGAFAEVSGAALVTTNADDFTAYFPNLRIIDPSQQPISPQPQPAAPATANPTP